MSRRFGRNQKRKMREALTSAQAHINRLEERARMLERKAEAYKAVVDGVREALGEQSIVFQPMMNQVLNTYLPEIRFADKVGVSCIPLSDEDISIQTDSIRSHAYAVIDTYVAANHWTRKTHFMVAFKDRNTLAYAIDERLLYEKDAQDFVEGHLAQYLAKAFMEGIKA